MTQIVDFHAPTASRPALRPAARVRFGDLVVRVLDILLDWQERARERHTMRGLDDHLLKDMGLSRADADHEAAKPFWRR